MGMVVMEKKKCQEWKGGKCIDGQVRTDGTPTSTDECEAQCLEGTWCFRSQCRREYHPKERTEGSKSAGCGDTCGKGTVCDQDACSPKRLEGESKRIEKKSETESLGDPLTCDTNEDCGSGRCADGFCKSKSLRTENETEYTGAPEAKSQCTRRKNCPALFPDSRGKPRGDEKDWVCFVGVCYWADGMVSESG